MILLNGKALSQKILQSLKFSNTSLHVILVGDDPSSIKYTNLKQQIAIELGINYQLHHLPADATQSSLIELIQKLNSDPNVTGFFVQLPLPSHLNKDLVLSSIASSKDVDGLNPNSNFTPAVVVGIIRLLENYQINFSARNVVIVNDSNLIGQPLKKIFETKGAVVTLANDQTQSLSQITQEADILISATGVKNLITADMVKEGSVVVDVANGDVDFVAVSPKCSYITPTFGGVGPITIASLFQNLATIATDANPAL